jgi:hypothetical protein
MPFLSHHRMEEVHPKKIGKKAVVDDREIQLEVIGAYHPGGP